MADSVEERVIQDVVSTIETVTQANGYDFDVAVVQRQQEDVDYLRNYPGAIVVHDGSQVVSRYIGATINELRLAILVGLEKPGPVWATSLGNLMSQISQSLMGDEGRGTFEGKANARRTDILGRFVGDHETDGGGVVRGELHVSVKYGFENADETSSF